MVTCRPAGLQRRERREEMLSNSGNGLNIDFIIFKVPGMGPGLYVSQPSVPPWSYTPPLNPEKNEEDQSELLEASTLLAFG